MQIVAIDSETALIRPGQLAPPPACWTWQRPGLEPRIVHARDARQRLQEWLKDPNVLLVGAHVAFDLAVAGEAYPDLLPLIFDAYATDRVTDVQIRQKLLDIASGGYRGTVDVKGRWIPREYSLEALALRCAGIRLQKDGWRLAYGSFVDVPLEQWPERAREVQARAPARLAALEARRAAGDDTKTLAKEIEGLRLMIVDVPERCVSYPLEDARATLAVWQAQEKHAEYLADQYRQARAYWWLYLSSCWGLRTDAEGVATLRAETEGAIAEVQGDLLAEGLVRADGVRDTKAAKRRMIDVCRRDGLTLRRTDGHSESEGKCKRLDGAKLPDGDPACEEHVCLDRETCDATEDETLIDYAEFSTLKKVLSNDIPALEGGICWPVHTRYDLAETGRTTSSKPNIQNLRRLVGIREAFVPRAGRVFVAADYPQLELYTLAQCCISWLGGSKLADALNSGLDPHLALAATIAQCSYERAAERLAAGDEEISDVRELAKKANFGLPGGMGIAKFHLIVKKSLKPEIVRRLGISESRLKHWKEQWFSTWPEMRGYFARIASRCDESGRATVETLFTKRIRGGAYYCAACNNGFQGLGVDCAKEAGWRIARAEYTERDSPLFGARTVAFVHDEFLLEVDEDKMHDAAGALADLMVEGANVYLPDVPIPRAKVKPLAMRRWSKKAKPVFVDGRLVPWT